MSDDATYGSPVFDWSVLTVPTPLAMVRGQLGFSWLEVLGRLVTLDQDEFGWEPGPDALRVVRRGEERSPRTLGVGEWVMEWPEGSDSPQPRTIAWLVAHLTEAFFERWEWTFGPHDAQRVRDRLPLELRLGERREPLRDLEPREPELAAHDRERRRDREDRPVELGAPVRDLPVRRLVHHPAPPFRRRRRRPSSRYRR